MRIRLYVSAGKEQAWNRGEQHGLSPEALKMFRHAGAEHSIDYEVDESGRAVPVKLDGRDIVREADGEWAEKIRKTLIGDQETDHENADGILCQLLANLGYSETVKVYESIPKWFA